jgi:hypothetical protein
MTRISEADYANILRNRDRPRRTTATLPAPSEHDEQCAVIAWADAMRSRWPELDLLYAIPNGGKRDVAVAVKLKAEGVKAGIPDLHLAAMRGGYGGLYVEMKKCDHSNDESPAQKAMRVRLEAAGYRCVVAYGADEAVREIEKYLSMD